MNNAHYTEAEITTHKRVSMVWLAPIVALMIGAWMVYQHVSSQGPEITLIMDDASGIEIGKTEIKSLNVSVGVVTAISLNSGYNSVTITAQMHNEAEQMLKEDTLFWVAKPRIDKQGISGLDTLFSGAYIEIEPGNSSESQYNFTVLNAPPVAAPDAKGLRLQLTNAQAGKLDIGDPVLYKGNTAGRVEQVGFDVDTEMATYQLFIFEPYNELIRTNTLFWISPALDVQLSAKGFSVQMESVESLLRGGVTFGLAEQSTPGELVTQQQTQFKLFDSQKQMSEGQIDQHIEYVMLFDESIRGLTEGAPVEYRGLRIGSVAKIPLHSPSLQDESTLLPVLIHIEPTRLFSDTDAPNEDVYKRFLLKEFERGLKGSLKTGSLLTGALYIEVDYHQLDDTFAAEQYQNYPVFPNKTGGLAEFQKLLSDVAKKMSDLPLEQTVESMNSSLVALESTLNATEKAMTEVQTLLEKRESRSLPAEMQQTLEQMQRTLAGYEPNSVLYRDLDQTMLELKVLLNQLKPVVKTLDEKPNSLIFGADEPSDPIPPKGRSND